MIISNVSRKRVSRKNSVVAVRHIQGGGGGEAEASLFNEEVRRLPASAILRDTLGLSLITRVVTKLLSKKTWDISLQRICHYRLLYRPAGVHCQIKVPSKGGIMT